MPPKNKRKYIKGSDAVSTTRNLLVQLTLFQPRRGQILPTTVLIVPPPGFENLATSLQGHLFGSAEYVCYVLSLG